MIDGSVFGPMDLEIPMASEIVKRKLYENGGVVTIPLLKGQLCKVWASCDGQAFTIWHWLTTSKIKVERKICYFVF